MTDGFDAVKDGMLPPFWALVVNLDPESSRFHVLYSTIAAALSQRDKIAMLTSIASTLATALPDGEVNAFDEKAGVRALALMDQACEFAKDGGLTNEPGPDERYDVNLPEPDDE